MADIPGIIEGAHTGKGLGTRFLRHIERNSILLFMIPADSKDVREEYRILLGELEQYNPELLDKQRLLAVTKSDLLDEELTEAIRSELPDVPLLILSSLCLGVRFHLGRQRIQSPDAERHAVGSPPKGERLSGIDPPTAPPNVPVQTAGTLARRRKSHGLSHDTSAIACRLRRGSSHRSLANPFRNGLLVVTERHDRLRTGKPARTSANP